MIKLHRLAHVPEPLLLNADLVLSVEAHPDAVVTLTTGQKIVVTESVDEVVAAVRAWRVSVLAQAMKLAQP
jgi:flagellar protein FlbD